MNQFSKNIMLWGVIALFMALAFNMFNTTPKGPQEKLAYSEFVQRVEAGGIAEVVIQGDIISGKLSDGRAFQTYAPEDPAIIQKLVASKVLVRAEPPEEPAWYISLLASWFPIILLIGVWIFFMRQMQGGSGKAMSFGRSKAKMMTQDQTRVTFSDVAGVDEAKEELTEIVDFLSNPKKFTRLGGRIPKGVLLVGSPGTGKTLLARAVAGEASVPFFSISGSDFVEMFVGVGASRVRDLFVQGKKNAPCLIFIDEIDAVGRQRGAGLGGGHDEREQTLNQLLVEMDGFESNEGVILIAATNRPDVLDPALLRPGRFDRQVVVPSPDLKGRVRILEVHARRAPLGKDVDLEVLARGTPGFSGASLENLVNEAALQAAKNDKDVVSMADFEYAKDKVLMGKERRSMIMTDEEKRTTAYHEGGHALVATLLPKADPIHKVTIIPRGRALGLTMQLPERDRYGYSREDALNRLRIYLGGRVAEEIIFDSITTGASSDIQSATGIARQMVCKWGMSDVIGPVAIGDENDEVFLGRGFGHTQNYSEETARVVDAEVRKLIDDARNDAHRLLTDNIKHLHAIADALLERETITGSDMALILAGKELPKDPDIKGPDKDAKQQAEADATATVDDEASFTLDSGDDAAETIVDDTSAKKPDAGPDTGEDAGENTGDNTGDKSQDDPHA